MKAAEIVLEGWCVAGQSGDLVDGGQAAEIQGRSREQADEERGEGAGETPPHKDADERFENEGDDDRDDGGDENDARPIKDGDDDASGYGGEGVAVNLLLNGTLRFFLAG